MRKITRLFVLLWMLCLASFMSAQMSGSYAVPGTITSIAAAINSLNTLGVSGPVTIAISAGYTETAVSGGYTLNSVAGASSINNIVFQKSGAGLNPLVYAYTGGTATPASAVQDGIWLFSGADYITIDGIDLQDPNTTNPGSMEFGYGFFKANTGDGCQYNTIRNCRITLNRVNNATGSGPSLEGSRAINMVNATMLAQTTALTPTAAAGSNSYNKFYSNTIENCNYGIALIGFAASTPFALADQFNDVGGTTSATGNTIINFGGGGTAGAAAAVVTLAQYNINVSYNQINNNNGSGVNHGAALRGIFLNTATSANSTVLSNTISLKSAATTAVCYGINNASGSTAASNTLNISNNQIVSGSYTTATSGAFSGIINSGTPAFAIINNNLVSSNTHSGTGTFSGVDLGSPSVSSVTSNTISANVRNGASGTMYGIRIGTSSLTVSGNQVTNNGFSSTSGSSGSVIYGIYDVSSPVYEVYTNNQINNLYISGGSTSQFHVIYGFYSNTSSSSVKTYSGNTVNSFSIATTLAGGAIYGFYNSLASSIDLYRNKVYDLMAGGATANVYGVYLASGSNQNAYNNLIADLRAPASTQTMAVAGFYLPVTSAVGLYHNTVLLNATSSASVFGTAALYASTGVSLDLRNNVLVNLSTAAGTGLTMSYCRSNTTLGTYSASSNNNLFYAGTPGASNLIFYDGTNAIQSLSAYKTFVASRDAGSVSENPSFVSTTGSSNNFLNISTTVPTQIESAGMPVATVVNDFAGSLRNTSSPDIGAWEGNYVLNDLSAPAIVHSVFTSTCVTSDLIISATITDNGSGLPTSGALQPRVYYKKNNGSYVSGQGALVSGSAASGIWNFTISAASLGGLAISDIVSYYLVAQDQSTLTTNVGSLPSSGFAASDVNNITSAPTTPFSYTVSATLNGVYTVGNGGNFQTLTQAAIAYNNNCLGGPVTFSLTDALYSAAETFPIVFSNNPSASASNSLLIVPAAGSVVAITPTSGVVTSVMKFRDARFITLNGSNGAGSSLTINNINSIGTSANIWLASSGLGNKSIALRNLTINGASRLNTYGIQAGADGVNPVTAGGADNDAVSISGNTFQTVYTAIYGAGTSSLTVGGLDNWSITNNIVGPAASNASGNLGGSGIDLSSAVNLTISSNQIRFIQTANISVSALRLGSGVDGFSIAQNSITNIFSSSSGTGTNAIAGIYLGTATRNGTLNANLLSTIASTTSFGYGVRGIIVNSNLANANIHIQNNMISDIFCYTDANYIYWNIGISVENNSVGGVNINHNSVSLFGSYPAYASTGSSAALYLGNTNGTITCRNNIFSNTYSASNYNTLTNYAMYFAGTSTLNLLTDYNNYYVGGVNNQPVLCFFGGAQTSLTALQASFGGNLNSKNIAAAFNSNNDLHLQQASINQGLDAQGLALPNVSTDFDGQARNASTPDIGADEVTLQLCSTANAGTVAVPSISVCTGTNYSISTNGAAIGLSASYLWKISSTAGGPYAPVSGGTGSASTAFQSGTVSAGVYYLQLEMTCGSTSATAVSNEATVTVLAYPTVTAGASSSSICASANLTLTGSGTGATNYLWSGPNGFTSTLQNPVITNVASGVYNLIGSVASCSSAVSPVTVTTGGAIFSSVSAASPSAICTGGTTQLISTDYAVVPVNQYVFSSASSTSLLPLSSNAQLLVTSNIDDTPSTAQNIGFPFSYNGSTYTQFAASPDGWVKLGPGNASAQYVNAINAPVNSPILYPYWDDLATGNGGYVKSDVFGSAPNRTLVIEWFVTIPRSTSGAANSSFQALLHEATGSVEFRYGTMGSDNYGLSSCGLTGSGTNYNCVTYSTTTTSTLTPNDNNATQPSLGTAYVFTPPAVTFSWSSLAPLSSYTNAIVTSTPPATSVYSLNVSIGGCVTSKTVSVLVVSPPSMNIAASSTSVCPGGTTTLTASGANSYTWASGSGSATVVTPTTATTNYTVLGSNGVCTSTASKIIYGLNNPIINVSGSSGICTGQTASLVASGAQSYTWSTGTVSNTLNVTPTSNTTYTVTGTDAFGCSSSTTQLVSVAASLSISVSGPTAICIGQSATLTGVGGTTYDWSTGVTAPSIVLTPSSNTGVNVTGYTGTCFNNATHNIVVNSLPTVGIAGSSTVCSGSLLTLTATGVAASFSWNTGATGTTANVTPTSNSIYTLTAFSAQGCAATATHAVATSSLPVLFIVPSSNGVCLNASATLTVVGASTNTWNVNGSPTTNTLVVTPTVTSIYSVSGKNAQGCLSTAAISIASYSLPALNISPSSLSVCAQSVANFTATGANSYTWSAPGGNSATVSYTPNATTIYTVSGENTNSCVSTATVSVFTYSIPTLSISPASPTVCELTPLTYTASGANTYLWNNAVMTPTFFVAPGFSNTYTLVGTGSNGCSTSQTVGVNVLPAPIIVITPSMATQCFNAPSVYTASGAQSYTWVTGSNDATTTITPTTVTQYTVAGTGTNGCIGQGSVLVLLHPTFSVNVSPLSATVCPNTSTVFTASGAVTYSWSNGPTTASAAVAPSVSTIYTVSGFDANLCEATQTVAVATRTVPTISLNPTTPSLCAGGSVLLSASGVNSYSWNTGAFGANVTVSPSVTTNYTVNGKNAGSCVATKTIAVTVYQNPVLNLSASSETICVNESVTFTASGANSYTWSSPNASGDTYSATPNNSQLYTVSGMNANGCVGTASVFIVVQTCSGLVEQTLLQGIQLYPNPSTGQIYLDFGFEGDKDVYISNSVGAIVNSLSTDKLLETIHLEGLAKGIYFVKISSHAKTANYKVVIN